MLQSKQSAKRLISIHLNSKVTIKYNAYTSIFFLQAVKVFSLMKMDNDLAPDPEYNTSKYLWYIKIWDNGANIIYGHNLLLLTNSKYLSRLPVFKWVIMQVAYPNPPYYPINK